MPISRVVCPKCGEAYEAQWLPYPAPEFRVGNRVWRSAHTAEKDRL